MLATNHTLVGITLGQMGPRKWRMVPFAFASHFAIDTLPQAGHLPFFKDPFFPFVAAFDVALGCTLVAFTIRKLQRDGAKRLDLFRTSLCAFAAMSPDVLYAVKGWLAPFIDGFYRFHAWIQWASGPWGLIFELAFAAILIAINLDVKCVHTKMCAAWQSRK